ncbi:MAG: hypothetical protein ACR2J5_05060, partial [Geodermatophilaceae bacterium]
SSRTSHRGRARGERGTLERDPVFDRSARVGKYTLPGATTEDRFRSGPLVRHAVNGMEDRTAGAVRGWC